MTAEAKPASSPPSPSFTGYADFTPAFNAARQAAIAVFGPRWDLHPQTYVWARLPAAWARVRVAGRNVPRPLPASLDPPLISAPRDSLPARERLPDAVIGERWSKTPRDRKLPIARFWPSGELPTGPEYALTGALPEPKRSKAKLAIVHSIDPARPRRPSGIGLPSGYDRADGDFYIEPRWLIDGLLRVEQFNGCILDPFCGGGNIVGACLQQGLLATGSDRFDRGFGEQRDAFSIFEPFDNLISNPPFSRIEAVIRHFLPLVRRKLVLLARLNVLEGQERRTLFRQAPPARVWVSSRRASIPPGDLAHPRDQFGAVVPLPASGGSTAFCWICWDRSHVGPTCPTVLDWL